MSEKIHRYRKFTILTFNLNFFQTTYIKLITMHSKDFHREVVRSKSWLSAISMARIYDMWDGSVDQHKVVGIAMEVKYHNTL